VTTPLEDYAMIGDGETVALVSRAGSVDWLCLPRFDSPACCAALLGTSENGRWSIGPESGLMEARHRYLPGTLILETDLTSAEGTIRLTDFMPMRATSPALVRIVTGVSGSVPTHLDAAFRFDYGNMPPWITRIEGGAVMHVGPDQVVLRGPGELSIDESSVRSRFRVEEGSRHVFVLAYGPAHDEPPESLDAEAALEETRQFWESWIGRFDQPVEHAGAVRRSLLTLKALIYRPTGGLVAAPTTSLPEQPGGPMNWDYRYCWLRDATFTLSALVECGYMEEATAWRDWMLRAIAGEPDKMQIMYRVDGSRRLDEAVLPWLPGYRFAKPVRVGNSAAGQLQLDVYGELIRSLHASEKAGMERTLQGRYLEHTLVDHVERIWVEPDQGLWESRGEAHHYTYSKVMAWVALDRFLDGAGGKECGEAERRRLEAVRDHMRDVICREGFDAGLGSFTSYFGGQEVDASLLLLPKVGFLPVDDPRMAGTIARIEKELVVDSLVRRHLMSDPVPEGAFIACSFWLAECQLGQGRRSDAVRTIERALAVQSDVGLLSEEYDIGSRRLTGNHPQALSHLALIQALLALARFDRDGHLGETPTGGQAG
jgi:GH15 family glucan-1,4-alpha-glucosidase